MGRLYKSLVRLTLTSFPPSRLDPPLEVASIGGKSIMVMNGSHISPQSNLTIVKVVVFHQRRALIHCTTHMHLKESNG